MPRPIPDYRTTREAEETRDMTNYKPRRTKDMRAFARQRARQDSDGAWRSATPVLLPEKRKDDTPKDPEKKHEGARAQEDTGGDVRGGAGDSVVR